MSDRNVLDNKDFFLLHTRKAHLPSFFYRAHSNNEKHDLNMIDGNWNTKFHIIEIILSIQYIAVNYWKQNANISCDKDEQFFFRLIFDAFSNTSFEILH